MYACSCRLGIVLDSWFWVMERICVCYVGCICKIWVGREGDGWRFGNEYISLRYP